MLLFMILSHLSVNVQNFIYYHSCLDPVFNAGTLRPKTATHAPGSGFISTNANANANAKVQKQQKIWLILKATDQRDIIIAK